MIAISKQGQRARAFLSFADVSGSCRIVEIRHVDPARSGSWDLATNKIWAVTGEPGQRHTHIGSTAHLRTWLHVAVGTLLGTCTWPILHRSSRLNLPWRLYALSCTASTHFVFFFCHSCGMSKPPLDDRDTAAAPLFQQCAVPWRPWRGMLGQNQTCRRPFRVTLGGPAVQSLPSSITLRPPSRPSPYP